MFLFYGENFATFFMFFCIMRRIVDEALFMFLRGHFYMKVCSFFCLLLVYQYALSYPTSKDPLTMTLEEFYAVEKNQVLYKKEQKNGTIEKMKNELVHNCSEAKSAARIKTCACYQKELEKVGSKRVFYTHLFYQAYEEASFSAQLDGNEEEYNRLKQLNNSKDSYILEISNQCKH